MSTPAPTGSGRSSLRTAGVGLVGLALAFSVIGVVVGSTPGPSAAAGSALRPTSGGVSLSPAPSSAPASTVVPTVSAPPSAPPAASPTPAAAAVDPRATVEVVVLNNSTVGGLAARAATQVRGRGWTVAGVGNFTGTVSTTTVYYRSGTAEEAAARVLAVDLQARVAPRFDGLPGSAEAIVLVVTSDYAG